MHAVDARLAIPRELLTALVLVLFFAQAAKAELDCTAIPNLSASIANFLRKVDAAQQAGGSLTIKDVLIGVTGISAADQQALATRGLVILGRAGNGIGAFANDGDRDISIQGIFASTITYFNIPRAVRGTYRRIPDGAEFSYDPRYTIHLGESVLGFKVFRTLNRTIISRNYMRFYFDANSSGEPDRCYAVLPD